MYICHVHIVCSVQFLFTCTVYFDDKLTVQSSGIMVVGANTMGTDTGAPEFQCRIQLLLMDPSFQVLSEQNI